MAIRTRPDAWTPADGFDLEPAVEEAVRAMANTVVVAGPGAGKTELLAQRACYLLQTGICNAPRRILAISFKRDAARNLSDRVAKRAGPEHARWLDSMTSDAFAKGLLDRFNRSLPEHWRPTQNYELDKDIGQGKARDMLDSIPRGAEALTEADIAYTAPVPFYQDSFLAMLPIERPAPVSVRDRAALALWRLYLRRPKHSALNFDMINRLSELILRANPKILAALRATYSFVFLDEFQDTTGIQYELICTAFLGSSAILTAVGDNKQRIMGWANALEGVFDLFQADFGARVARPEHNHRSAPELVRIQQVVARVLDAEHRHAIAVDDGSAGPGECRLFVYKNHVDEAAHLSDLIESWIAADCLKPRDICILARMKPPEYTAALKEALGRRSIKARIESELQDLLSEPITTMLLHFFKLGSTRRAPESWAATTEILQRIGGDDTEEILLGYERRLSGFLRSLRAMMRDAGSDRASLQAVMREILIFIRWKEYVALFPQYGQGNFLKVTLENFTKHFTLSRAGRAWCAAIDDFEGADSVPIMTMHKSKGLEYHTIIFVGLEDAALRDFQKNQHDEQCGFFVALSRAKKRAIFTFSGQRPVKFGQPAQAQGRANIQELYNILLEAGIAPEVIS